MTSLALLLLAAPAQGTLLADVSAARGIQPYLFPDGLSAGVTAVDFDDDGDVDLFVPNGLGAPDQLYVNDGTGHFTELAQSLGVATDGHHRGAIFVDVNGDGLRDLLVGGDCFEDVSCVGTVTLKLFLQQPGPTFVDATAGAGLGGDLGTLNDSHLGGMAAGDLDGDGDQDLVVSIWEGLAYAFMNDGTGHFVERGAQLGIRDTRAHWQPVIHDFDADGRLDVFQAVDFGNNKLWRNLPTGVFVDLASVAGVDFAFNEMGVALGDFDRDNDLDVYVTNIFSPFGRYNTLFSRNGTSFSFDEVSAPMQAGDSGCGWGTSFVDVDLDGWPELCAMNECPGRNTRLFWNRMGASAPFLSVEVRAGFDDGTGTGLATFDMDGDGDRDFVRVKSNRIELLENRLPIDGFRRHLLVRPRRLQGNVHSTGAIVEISYGGVTTRRAIVAGSSILGQEPAEAHFGVGDAAAVDVTVSWPDGTTWSASGVSTDDTLDVVVQ